MEDLPVSRIAEACAGLEEGVQAPSEFAILAQASTVELRSGFDVRREKYVDPNSTPVFKLCPEILS